MRNLIFLISILIGSLAFGQKQALLTADQISGIATEKDFMGDHGHFETPKSLAGWLAYADTAGTSPVDGVGGSPTVTCTRNTSSLLTGVGSLAVTKDAANRQGQGCAIPFTIDKTKRGKVLRITGDYVIASGTYADDDVRFYVYDVTNSRLIEPVPTNVKKSTLSNVPLQPMEFQASIDSTSYRLIIHVSSTSASAYVVAFDNIRVSEGPSSRGPPVTAPAAYAPTLSGLGTPSTNDFKWTRDGKWLSGDFTIIAGTTSATTASFTLPPGLNIDTSVISGIARVGSGGTNVTPFSQNIVTNTATSTSTLYWTLSTGNVQTGVNGNTWTTGTIFTGNFRVPIVGWDAAVPGSTDTGTKLVAAQGSKFSGSQTSNGSFQDVAFTVTQDTVGAFDGTTYTVKEPGDYVVMGMVGFGVNGTGARAVRVSRAGSVSDYQLGSVGSGSASLQVSLPFNTKFTCKVGDTLKVQAYQTSGGNLGYEGSDGSWVSIFKVSSPQQVPASDSVNARYTFVGTASTVANNTATNLTSTYVTYTKIKDSHSAFNTSTGVYTFPVSGVYRATFRAIIVNTAASTGAMYTSLIQAGSTSLNSTAVGPFAAASAGATPTVSDTFVAQAGDTLTLQVTHTNGSGIAIFSVATYNSFSIERIGNY